MNLKKVMFINVVVMFLLSVLFHFMYNFLPCFVTSVLFPVNESIWEHMKLFVTSILVCGLIDKFIFMHFNIYYNNLLFSSVLTSILSVIIYLVIYLPLYKLFGEVMFISIGLMIVIYIVMAFVSYKILTSNKINVNSLFLILVILITYVSFTVLTYYPVKYFLFYDTSEKKYGI